MEIFYNELFVSKYLYNKVNISRHRLNISLKVNFYSLDRHFIKTSRVPCVMKFSLKFFFLAKNTFDNKNKRKKKRKTETCTIIRKIDFDRKAKIKTLSIS